MPVSKKRKRKKRTTKTLKYTGYEMNCNSPELQRLINEYGARIEEEELFVQTLYDLLKGAGLNYGLNKRTN